MSFNLTLLSKSIYFLLFQTKILEIFLNAAYDSPVDPYRS